MYPSKMKTESKKEENRIQERRQQTPEVIELIQENNEKKYQ